MCRYLSSLRFCMLRCVVFLAAVAILSGCVESGKTNEILEQNNAELNDMNQKLGSMSQNIGDLNGMFQGNNNAYSQAVEQITQAALATQRAMGLVESLNLNPENLNRFFDQLDSIQDFNQALVMASAQLPLLTRQLAAGGKLLVHMGKAIGILDEEDQSSLLDAFSEFSNSTVSLSQSTSEKTDEALGNLPLGSDSFSGRDNMLEKLVTQLNKLNEHSDSMSPLIEKINAALKDKDEKYIQGLLDSLTNISKKLTIIADFMEKNPNLLKWIF